MKKVFLLLIFCHVTSAEEHSLTIFSTGLYRVTNFPEFVGVVMVDGVEVVYCDSNMKRAEPKQGWMKKLMKDDPKHMDWYTEECRFSQHFFSSTIGSLMQHSNKTEDIHVFQRMYGCEWDVYAFDEYAYDEEDLMEFNLEEETWIPSTLPQAKITKQQWDRDKERIKNITIYLTQRCPDYLKKYLEYGSNILKRTVLPSVSLLQKTPSSPVSCHATGFYPERASLIWMKDGEELYEDVDHGEILPNHDGTFQMSIDLELSSVQPEDWRRYDCVFQPSGVKDNLVTRLDKAVIRTNREEHFLTIFFTGLYRVTNFPEFVGVVMVDGVEVVYCDSNMKRAEPKQGWMKKLMKDDPKHMDWYTEECRFSQHFFSSTIGSLMQHSNKTEDIHVFQRMYGCEWDVYAFDEYAYDEEDLMEFNLEEETWIPSTLPQAKITKQQWDRDKERIKNITIYLTQRCPDYLKKYLEYGSNILKRTVLPSVSLLQKTPSSPVSCHATGFYPERASLIWRKDGEELYEDVDHGEILPNHDGTFQMSIDLKLSSVQPEDWRRYDCVFQPSGVKDNLVTRLDKAVIRTNRVPVPSTSSVTGGAVAGLLLLLAVCITGFLIRIRKIHCGQWVSLR